MTGSGVQKAKAAVVRDRVLDAVVDLIHNGTEVTFTRVASAADVPERTVYRYFPNRQALIAGLFKHVNDRVGFDGDPPADHAAMNTMVRTVFPGFDTMAPVIDELLASPEGRQARLAGVAARRAAASSIVAAARPDLDPHTARSVAAIVQVLGTAAVWRALRDFWDLDGVGAAEAVTTAIDILLVPPTPERT